MNESSKFSFFDAGVLIVVFPTLIYFLTYLYEVGYITTFGIPTDFINVELITIINIIPSLIPRVVIIFVFWNIVVQLFDTKSLKDPIFYQIYEMATVCSFAFIIALFSHDVKSNMIVALQTTLIVFGFYFIFPLITRWKVKGYRNKLLIQINQENATNKESLRWYYFKKIGHLNVKTFIYIAIVSIAFFQAGVTEAVLKDEYYKLNNDVVIRIYDGLVICCEYDEENKVINNSSFKVLELGGNENLEFEKVPVERLKIEQN